VPHTPKKRALSRTPAALRLSWFDAALLLFLFASGPAVAQTPAPAVESVPEVKAEEPASIPLAEVAAQTETLRQTLRRTAETIRVDPEIQKIEEKIPALVPALRTRQLETKAALEGSPSLDQLADLDRDWAGRERDLRRSREVLAKRASILEDELSTLRGTQALWDRTLAEAKKTGAPGDVSASISSNIDQIEALRRQAASRRGQLLSLLTQVANEEALAADLLSDIRDSRVLVRQRLFEPDSKPLWQALMSEPESSGLSTRVEESLRTEGREFGLFVQENRRAFIPIALAFLVAWAGAASLGARLKEREDATAPLSGSSQVFARPFSTALLLAALLTSAAFPYAPSVFLDIGGALLLIPLFRLATPLVERSFRPFLLALAGFYLLDRFRDALDGVVLLERCLFLLQVLGGAALLGWLLRPHRLASLPSHRESLRLLGWLLRAAAVSLAISALANALGYMAFSRIVGEGVFSSAYLGILFYAAFRVSLTILVFALTSRRLGSSVTFQNFGPTILLWGRRLIAGAAFLLWGRASLEGFGIREPVENSIWALLSTPVAFGTISVSLADIFGFALTVASAIALARIVRTVLADDVLPRFPLGRGVGGALSATAQYAILLTGFFLALGAAGVDFSRFTILAGAFGVGIGFGLQNVVNNFVSGLILLYERPVQVGDVVEVGPLAGSVTRIGIRSSTVRTFKGSEVIVPNANLISDQLVNWTLSDPHRRIDIPVGVAYGTDHQKTLDVLRAEVRSLPYVLKEPEASVFFRGLGDSALLFEVRFWVLSSDFMTAETEVVSGIYSALRREGIEIPFPQRDVHIKPSGPPQGKDQAAG